MGFRFRKSMNFGGFRINLSKSGVGGSVGGKGARFTVKAGGGTRSTMSIPGTGLSYVSDSSKGDNNSGVYADQSSGSRIPYIGFAIVFKILGWLLIIPSLLVTLILPIFGLVGIGTSVACFFASKHYKKKGVEQKEAEAKIEAEEAESAQN